MLSRAELVERISRLPRDMQEVAAECVRRAYLSGDPEAPDRDLPPLSWAEKYRRIDDQDFSLDRFKPLVAIYEDEHPDIVVMKPAQVGVSEWAISRTLHTLDVGARYYRERGVFPERKAGLNVGYLFSTDKALSAFSKERFSSIVTETSRLTNLFTDYDDVTFKQAGQSYLHLRGGKSTAGLKSFAADELFLDEYDEIPPAQMSLALKRLRASSLKFLRRLSTPTFPDKGIHAAYLESDQCVWEVHCPRCGGWNELDFFRDVRVAGEVWETWRYWDAQRIRNSVIDTACPGCKEPLDRCGEGRWRAQRPEVTGVRGYHVPALCFPFVSLATLAVTAISEDPVVVTEFYRSDLGLPYEPAGSRVTEDMLRQLSHELDHGKLPDTAWRNTTMGVDVGARFHYRVSSTGADGKRYVRAMGSVRGWDGLDELMRTFKVRHCVIDALPEQHACEAWAAKHKGKVLRAFYPNPAALKGRLFRLPGEAPENPDESEEQAAHTVQINRTMAMDTVYNLVAVAKEAWPSSIHNDKEVVAHMTAPVRIVKDDDEGQSHASWVHQKPDHLYHACVYDVIALKTLPKTTFVGALPYTGEG
jgi:hypothetical protein